MHQPALHDLLVCLCAPTQAWSGPDGQIRAVGAQGIYSSDVRVVSEAVLTVDGAEPDAIAASSYGATEIGVVALVRALDADGADPTFRVDRRRRAAAGLVEERITITTGGRRELHARVRLSVACDLAPIDRVNAGQAGTRVAALVDDGDVVWAERGVTARISAPGATVHAEDLRRPAFEWDVYVRPGTPAYLTWRLDTSDTDAVVVAASGPLEWATPSVVTDDRRFGDLLGVSLNDLSALRLATPDEPTSTFLAAGAPWYFTLFGRDSLWAARFLLPLGTSLAASTLVALARRQGRTVQKETAEEPGKILHEVRRAAIMISGQEGRLPPVYYGTVDATPLWVCLLHDAWRWGMPVSRVRALLPHLRAALAWMTDFGDADGDGLLEYVDRSGHGLTNQGWKDSSDAVQWRDGRLARPPIALAEVQGYAYEAAMSGAALLDALGDRDDDRAAAQWWRAWAGHLAGQFRATFWVTDADGSYPAIALDADKQPVDTLTSNLGHLLGTGLLDAAECAAVAGRLVSAELDSGFGLRTLSSASAGYWPLRYHGGTVWTHDTAIAVSGLARAGFSAEAAKLATGLVDAAPAFDFRMPELFGGDPRGAVARPTPYPASCRPQAWSAAASVAILGAMLGLDPDVPGGRLGIRPAAPFPFGATSVSGLVVDGRPLGVRVDAGGNVLEVSAPDGIDVGRT